MHGTFCFAASPWPVPLTFCFLLWLALPALPEAHTQDNDISNAIQFAEMVLFS